MEASATSVELRPKNSFVDPAIVSYDKPDGLSGQSSQHHEATRTSQYQEPETEAPSDANPLHSLPKTSTPSMIHSLSRPTAQTKDNLSSSFTRAPEDASASASATLSGPFNDISLNGHELQVSEPEREFGNGQPKLQSLDPEKVTGTPASRPPRWKRGGRKARGAKDAMASTPTPTPIDLEHGSAPQSTQKRRSSNKKGWRQTPLLEEPTTANIRLPRTHQGPTPPDKAMTPGSAIHHSKSIREPVKDRRRRYKEEDDQNGWATGEATDIQDMGDFDFEENHKKFDKRKVFDQIRRDDTTADEARLVNFNRLPSARPGTLGGKYLHYTEQVLSSPINKAVDHSSGDSEIDISETRISSGRSVSRASTRRKQPSRKASALAKSSFDHIASLKLKTDSSTSHRKISITQTKSCLLIGPFRRVCPCISPLQMLELEQLAITELALTEDVMTENAAVRIAQTAYGLTSPDSPRQGHSANIVILAGNNKTGSRAIAAGRHLRDHGSRVVLCVLGLEREEDLIDSVRRQLRIFRNCGGEAIKQDALMKTLRKLQWPADLIVDALLGMHISFDDLRSDDQAAYFQLVCWTNGSAVEILSLDVPSGIDASTGECSSLNILPSFPIAPFPHPPTLTTYPNRHLNLPRLLTPRHERTARLLPRCPQNRSPNILSRHGAKLPT